MEDYGYRHARYLHDKSREAAAAKAPAPARAAAKPAAPKISAADVSVARTLATSAERKRWAEVFASEHSVGRERGCANLLTCDRNYSSAAILKHLATMPKDREWMANTPANRAQADAVWDDARAQSGAAGRILTAQRKAHGLEVAAKPSGDVWADAYAANAALRPAERILAAQTKAGGR